MGNSETRTKKQTKKSIQISHPAFETAQLVKTTTGRQLIAITVPMKSEKEYIEWTKNYKRIPKVNAVLYPEDTKFENKGCCGSSGIAHVQYSRFPYVLSQELQIRRNNSDNHFGEKELWLLLFTLVQSGQMFHIRRLKVGDIRPQNVLMNSEGEVRVLSQYSYPYGATNYDKSITNRQLITYLAPEEVKDLQFGKMKDQNDPLSVETFSMGLTVLDAALLSSSEKFYEKSGVFSFDGLNESLRLLAHIKYSPELTYIITKMCDPQPANRLKANEVLKLLKPFQSQILSKKPFNLKALPSGTAQQNSQSIINPINPQISNKTIQKKDEYMFVPGVVFDARDQGLLQSSLMHGKEIAFRMSKIPNTYTLSQQEEVTNLNSPVLTTIYYPPITIQLPQPIHQNSQSNHA